MYPRLGTPALEYHSNRNQENSPQNVGTGQQSSMSEKLQLFSAKELWSRTL